MKPIKLKIDFELISHLLNVSVFYMDQLADNTINLVLSQNRELHEKIYFSITHNLYLFFRQRNHIARPPKSTTITLEQHDALVLKEALLKHIEYTNDPYQKNRSEMLKNKLYQELTNQENLTPIKVS